jgi:D-arabinose 1-dehydrogenase-like Zn-dependent alcohol dehydrogenase
MRPTEIRKMTAAVAYDYGQSLRLEQLPVPLPSGADAVLRVHACGICRSDWHLWNGDWTWRTEVRFPHVFGHELAGEVVALGPEARGTRIGARVTVPFHLSCGECEWCSRGHAGLCDRYTAVGFQINGGFAEYVRIPNAHLNLIELPDEVEWDAAASLGCRFMSAFHALHDRAGLSAGDCLVVFGAGGLGLATVQIGVALGARVIAVDPNLDALDRAAREGALTLTFAEGDLAARILDLAGSSGPRVTVDAVGTTSATRAALDVLAKGGTHVQLGLTGRDEQGEMRLPIDRVVKREQRIVGSLGCPRASYEPLLALVASGALDPARSVAGVVKLAGVTQALHAMTSYATSGVTVVHP